MCLLLHIATSVRSWLNRTVPPTPSFLSAFDQSVLIIIFVLKDMHETQCAVTA